MARPWKTFNGRWFLSLRLHFFPLAWMMWWWPCIIFVMQETWWNVFPMAENVYWKTNQEKDVLSFLFVTVNTNSSTNSPASFAFNILPFEIWTIQVVVYFDPNRNDKICHIGGEKTFRGPCTCLYSQHSDNFLLLIVTLLIFFLFCVLFSHSKT